MLTNHSTVTLIDSMGDDKTVANAARVSFAKEVTEFGPGDEKLIRYLAKHNHWTPFSHVMVTLRIKMPVFVARQWFKHTVGLSRNEISRRYVDDTPEFYLPDVIRARPSGSVKQGSGGAHPVSDGWRHVLREHYDRVLRVYDALIADGVAPEQARMVLPMSHMTEFYETASLAAYARVAGLRLDAHAQEETRDVALLIAPIMAGIVPVSWAALVHGAV